MPGVQIASLMQLSPSFAARNNIRVIKRKTFLTKSFSIGESARASFALVRCALWAALHRYLRLNVNSLVNSGLPKEYYEADVIVDLSMDHLNDVLGIIPVMEHSRDILIGAVLGKPVVIYAQSIGPYRGRFAAWVARLALNKVSLITVREEVSRRALEEIKVNRPTIKVTADSAFLLKPASRERIREVMSALGIEHTAPIVGIAVPEGELLGAQSWRGLRRFLRSAFHLSRFLLPEKLFIRVLNLLKRGGYYVNWRATSRSRTISALAEVADYLVKELNATVLLIPHVLMPDDYADKEQDARTNVRAIHNLASQRDRIIPITGSYTAEEMKGVIGKLDMLISAKMHAAIAAISQSVPTIAIGAHPKFRGIMHMLGMEEWVCEEASAETMTGKVKSLWQQREQIRQELTKRIPAVIEQAMLNGKLVSDLLDSHQLSQEKTQETL